MFEPCRGCDTADLFHFDAYIERPPWGPRMSLIKTRTQLFWALVRLLSFFSVDVQYAVFVLHGGGIGMFIRLRVPGGDEGAVNALAADASKREF